MNYPKSLFSTVKIEDPRRTIYSKVMRHPGVVGMVVYAKDGALIFADGDSARIKGDDLNYFVHLSSLIGDYLELNSLEESLIYGDNFNLLCIPKKNVDIGVIVTEDAPVPRITHLISKL